MDRQRWGLAGLLAFEALIAAYTLANGFSLFSLMYVAGALVLALALATGPARWHFAALAVASGVRAWLQTAGGAPLGVWPTWLVPLGFAWLAVAPRAMPRLGVASVAAARTWFVVWYFLGGAWIIVGANVLGAAGAWLWASAREPAVGVAEADAGAKTA